MFQVMTLKISESLVENWLKTEGWMKSYLFKDNIVCPNDSPMFQDKVEVLSA